MPGRSRPIDLLVVIVLVLGLIWAVNSIAPSGTGPRLLVAPIALMAMAGLVVAATALRGRPVGPSLGWSGRRPGRQAIAGVGLWAVLAGLGVGYLAACVHAGVPTREVLGPAATSPAAFAARVAFTLVFVGPVEELVFRGYLLGTLRELTSGRHLAVLLTAVLFGLSHYPADRALLPVAVTTVHGLVYGYARVLVPDMSVGATSLAHGLYDTLLLTLATLAH
jgi:membrane protease YdiL (CAAX protease family)